jgi:hypothetical protein
LSSESDFNVPGSNPPAEGLSAIAIAPVLRLLPHISSAISATFAISLLTQAVAAAGAYRQSDDGEKLACTASLV